MPLTLEAVFGPDRGCGLRRIERGPFLLISDRLTFFGEGGGTFTAVNSATGAPVWHFESGQAFRASPMTYMVGGTQYVVLAGDGGILSFALPQ